MFEFTFLEQKKWSLLVSVRSAAYATTLKTQFMLNVLLAIFLPASDY